MIRSDNKDVEVYILHTRKYRDTSLLAEVFSREEGRFSLLFKGVRREAKKSSRSTGQIQPFAPIIVSLYGRGDLRTAVYQETAPFSHHLSGRESFIGLYINELMYRLIGKYEPLPALFDGYKKVLVELGSSGFELGMLRRFEFTLLMELGFGIDLVSDAKTGLAIDKVDHYRFVPQSGFERVQATDQGACSGGTINRMARGDFSGAAAGLAKWMVSESLRPLLGGRPLKSRELFTASFQ
jgi:DNA repair protein RecO (recombination protein O)